MRIGIGANKGETVAGALSHGQLEGVIVRAATERPQQDHLRKPRILPIQSEWAPCIFISSPAGSKSGLVDVVEFELVLPVVPNIIRVNCKIIRKGVLDAKVPGEKHGMGEVRGDPSDGAGTGGRATPNEGDGIGQIAEERLSRDYCSRGFRRINAYTRQVDRTTLVNRGSAIA